LTALGNTKHNKNKQMQLEYIADIPEFLHF